MSFLKRFFTNSGSNEQYSALQDHWTFYTRWLQQKLPQYHSYLNPSANEEQLATLKSYLPFDPPGELLQLYRLNNGDTSEMQDVSIGTFMQFEFLSISKLIEEHKRYTVIINTHPEFTNEQGYHSFPENTIKKTLFNTYWIPIFADGSGNFIGLDFAPDNNGVNGQVINFGRDEHSKFQIAKSLTDFFAFIKEQIENGNCDRAIVQEDDEGYSYGLYPESHLIDDLKNIVVKGKH